MAKIGYNFSIAGSSWQNPEELTTLLRIDPALIDCKKSIALEEEPLYATWEIYSPPIELDSFSAKRLLKLLRKKTHLIKEYISKNPTLEVKLLFVVEAHKDDYPSHIENDVILFLSEIEGRIEITNKIDNTDKFWDGDYV
jgi:hypothetical protein